MERLIAKRSCAQAHQSMLADLAGIVPFAVLGAALVPLLPAIAGAHAPRPIVRAAAAAIAFAASPCGLGTIGVAAIARQTAPAAAAGFLCVAGIFDFRAWVRARDHDGGHDFVAYVLAAIACAIVAVARRSRAGQSAIRARAVGLRDMFRVFEPRVPQRVANEAPRRARDYARGLRYSRRLRRSIPQRKPRWRMHSPANGSTSRGASAGRARPQRWYATRSRAAGPTRHPSSSAWIQLRPSAPVGRMRAARSWRARTDCACAPTQSNRFPRRPILSHTARCGRALRAARPECRWDLPRTRAHPLRSATSSRL